LAEDSGRFLVQGENLLFLKFFLAIVVGKASKTTELKLAHSSYEDGFSKVGIMKPFLGIKSLKFSGILPLLGGMECALGITGQVKQCPP